MLINRTIGKRLCKDISTVNLTLIALIPRLLAVSSFIILAGLAKILNSTHFNTLTAHKGQSLIMLNG